MGKISVYANEAEKQQIAKYANQSNMTISQYLLHKGLEKQITPNKLKSQIASIASQLYYIADELEQESQRDTFKSLGGMLYGLLKDQA